MENMFDYGGLFLMLYMVGAFCCAWLVTVFGVFGFVLACFGRYSWKALLVVGIWIACSSVSVALGTISFTLLCVAVSPAVGLCMWWLENKRLKTQTFL